MPKPPEPMPVTTERRRSSRSRGLLLFAKYPRAGSVKTRLVPPLSNEEAARLYEAFLRDAIRRYVNELADVRLILYAASQNDVESFRAMLHDELGSKANGVILRTQRGADLGERLYDAFAESFREGIDHLCAVGSDHPTLPLDVIRSAFSSLDCDGSDMVIGPADDGGYYLIGMNKPQAVIFGAMPWSTGRLFAQTLEAATAHGLRSTILPEWYDVDDERTLLRLVQDVDLLPSGSRTELVMRELRGTIPLQRGVASKGE